MKLLVVGALVSVASILAAPIYFPSPDRVAGWRMRPATGEALKQLDDAFDYIQQSSRNGGLLVVHRGWLIYERYFGKGHPEATPNMASCGKSLTSIALGILIREQPEAFPDGLDQKVFTDRYLPREAFPLNDPRKREIRLGHLLTMTAGIRGNNPGWQNGRKVTLDPAGPDGWPAMTDASALATSLWCDPGAGYSYATASVHLASIVMRQVTGGELHEFVRRRIAEPLGWGRWGYGYRNRELEHTPGGGGIVLRPTDALRFLYLLLNEGRWRDRQIVPAEYVRMCGRPSPYNPHSPYSLQFDVNAGGEVAGVPRDAYWKSGSGGHAWYIVPSLDLVAVKLGGRDGQYSEEDTGFPEPARSRENRNLAGGNWAATVEPEVALHETLRRVVRAVGRRP